MWIPRAHTLTGYDWAAAAYELLKPNSGNDFLGPRDPWTGVPLSYEKKLRITRHMWRSLDLRHARELYGMPPIPGNSISDNMQVINLSMDWCLMHTEHGGRGLGVAQLGKQAGIEESTLNYLARWFPSSSVEDYMRDSRANIISVFKRVVEKLSSGWRPDETYSIDRADSESALPLPDRLHFSLAHQILVEDPSAAQAESEGISRPERDVDGSAICMAVGTNASGEFVLHLLKGMRTDKATKTACGETLFRVPPKWKLEWAHWPFLSDLSIDHICNHAGCIAKRRALGLTEISSANAASSSSDGESSGSSE